jgi:hypothetical protein
MVVVLNTYRSPGDGITRWKWYHVVNPKCLRPGIKLQISFLDAAGAQISPQEIITAKGAPGLALYARPLTGRNRTVDEAIISPYWIVGQLTYFRTLTTSHEIRLSIDVLSRTVTVKVAAVPLGGELDADN